jgi:endonuclease-3 related protein
MTVAADAYRRMFDALGPQHWWPGDSPFEVMVGAVLVQQTSWANVERAIDNLRDADAMDPHRLAALPHPELEELIRPAGYFRVKARRLRHLVEFLVDRYGGSLDAMAANDATTLRDHLLSVHGIGPETADSILLYALDKPVMVVDAYTKRIWARHGWIAWDADYYQLQEETASQLPDEAPVLNEIHALLVEVGKRWCRTRPRCDECPLRDMLPSGGPKEPC